MYLKYYELKKCYIQLGKKYKLPDDIIRLIYFKTKKSIKDHENKQRIYHKNILLFKLISSPFDTKFHIFGGEKYIHKDILKTWMKKYEEVNVWNGFYNEILYEYRLPEGRNCEWAIKTSPIRKINKNGDNIVFQDIKEKLMIEIKIIFETNYLKKYVKTYTQYGDLYDISCVPADLGLKIKYLNTNDFNEIYYDYENFREWKGTVNEDSWVMIIDAFGDTTIPNL